MEETVTSSALAVGERFKISRQRLKDGDGYKRICVVSGIHGDELEGQYVCYELVRKIKEGIENLDGTLDVYPCLNPLGMNAMSRGIPQFDLDMNRIFPGDEGGTFAEYTAAKIVEDISGADAAIDIHASNIFLREIPQVRLNEKTADTLMPLARLLNTDFVWVHSASTVLESTLAYSLNAKGVPTLVVEMGVGMRITEEYGVQLVNGILCLMEHLGMWHGAVVSPRTPLIATDSNVSFVNANKAGIFLPDISHWSTVDEGTQIGRIIDTLNGEVCETVRAEKGGRLFTLREYPVVYCGSLIARILCGEGRHERHE